MRRRWLIDLAWGAALAALIVAVLIFASPEPVDFLYQNF